MGMRKPLNFQCVSRLSGAVPLSLFLILSLDISTALKHLEVELLNCAIFMVISIARVRGVWCRFSDSNNANLSLSTREQNQLMTQKFMTWEIIYFT